MSEAGRQSGLRQGTFNIPDLILPPLQAREPPDQIYNTYHNESNPRSHNNIQDQYWPKPFIGRQISQSYQSPSFSPINSAASDSNDVSVRRKQSHDGSPPRQSVESRKEGWQPETLKAPLPGNVLIKPYGEDVPRSPFEQHREARQHEVGSEVVLGFEASRSPKSEKLRFATSVFDPAVAKVIFSPSFQYELLIRQQPIAARACGFGDRDRRTIDPPPILEMIVHDPGASKARLPSTFNYPPSSVVHCELWSADTDTAEAHMPEVGERRQQRRLMGTLVSSPFIGGDEFGVNGCFFPFPDLSCRTTGKYRLKFTLVIIDASNIKPGDRLPFEATAISNVFEVYTAKTFPGMIESTELTKRLKAQGCLITVKKGHQRLDRKRTTRSSEENDHANSEDIDGDCDDSEHGHDKRQKT